MRKESALNTTIRRDVMLGLYCASIIMGAGLLSLPNVAARLGAGPALVTIFVLGIWMTCIYRRLAGSMFAYVQRAAHEQAQRDGRLDQERWIRKQVQERGSRIVAELLHDSGLGVAGDTTMILGMLFFVFLADVGYLEVGFHSLNAIAQALQAWGWLSVMILVGAGSALWAAAQFVQRLPHRFAPLYGTLKKIGVMSGTWCFGIAVLLVLRFVPGVDAQIGTVLGLALFTIAVLSGMFTTVPMVDGCEDLVPTAQHRVNIIMVLVTLGLLALAAVGVLACAAMHGLFVNVTLLASDAFQFSRFEIQRAWSDMIGVVLFSLVGTGLLNLTVYPSLFGGVQGKGRVTRLDRVVMIGTFLPVVVYLAWTVVTVVTLPSATLTSLDQAKEYSTIGLARLFSQVSPWAAAWVSFFGYSVALLAVTSACNGFTESLADQAAILVERSRHLQALAGSKDNLAPRVVILAAAMLIAFSLERFKGVSLSSLLSVAGSAGGGLLLLILPFFLPARGQQKSRWDAVLMAFGSGVSLTVLILSGIDYSRMNDFGSAAMTVVSTLIAVSVLVMVVWLVKSEPGLPGPDAGANILDVDLAMLEKSPVLVSEMGAEAAMN